MSLVNSFVNQIGREIGKDVYRGVKSSLSRGSSQVSSSDAFKSKVFSFKSSTYDKVTMRNLSALVEDAFIEIRKDDFDMHEVYAAIDDIIDGLKPFVDDKWKDMLEELDKKNDVSYKMALFNHKKWVESVVADLEVKITDYKDPSGDWINNPFLWIYLCIMIFIGMYAPEQNRLVGIVFFIALTSISMLVRNSKINELKKAQEHRIKSLEIYKDYLSKI